MSAPAITAETPITTVKGRELQVGMVLAYMTTPSKPTGQPKTITEIGEYFYHRGLDGYARVAKSGEWGILVPDNSRFEVFDLSGEAAQ